VTRATRLRRLAPRIERHVLGPRVYLLGVRWHDWHLGVIVLGALAVGALLGLVHDGFPTAVAAFAGLWLIAKDWRDLSSHRRDTTAWRLGLHRRPHPLRTFRRADPLPVLVAVAAATVAAADLLSALAPNASVHGHVLFRIGAVAELRVFQALAIPVAVALLVAAYYLFRRRLRALRFAVVLLVALGAFRLFRGFDVEEAVGDLGVAAILWWGRASFYVEHEPLPRRAALLRVPLVAAAAFLISLLIVAVGAPRAGAGAIVRETGDLLLWQPGPIAFHDELARLDLAIGLLGLVALAVVGYLVFRPLAAPRDLPDAEVRKLARALVRRHGTDTLAYFKLRRDKHYLFTPDQRAFLGYRVENAVLVVSGEPVGPDDALPELLEHVARFAERRGLRIAAVGVSDNTKDRFEQLGLKSLYIGDEAIVETAGFGLEGRAVRKLRQSVSRLGRAGFSAELVSPERAGPEVLAEIAAAAPRWRGEPERGFSMALDPPHGEHEDTQLLLARDRDGALRGFLHFVPSYGRDAVSLSTMLRDAETPNGLTEFMIVEAIAALRTQGVSEVSLNFAAFARVLHSPHGVAERLLGRLLVRADTFFQIERLYRFNAKFQPRWEARYLMYEGALSLPRTALATLWLEGQIPRPRLRRPGTGRRRATPGATRR
jgi:lysyl-tRNA synthetase, class II